MRKEQEISYTKNDGPSMMLSDEISILVLFKNGKRIFLVYLFISLMFYFF